MPFTPIDGPNDSIQYGPTGSQTEVKLVRVRTYLFPGVLRGLPGPRLATTPTNRPRRSLSSPGVMCVRLIVEAAGMNRRRS